MSFWFRLLMLKGILKDIPKHMYRSMIVTINIASNNNIYTWKDTLKISSLIFALCCWIFTYKIDGWECAEGIPKIAETFCKISFV